jgi:ABC-type branched-subunit amino acid transport system substrate-binding protein
MRLAAPVPLTGRYALQGQQMAAGLELFARRSGASVWLDDDESRPDRAVEIFRKFQQAPSAALGGGSGRGPDIVLGPYGSDSVRAVAAALPHALIWNHGAAANDVQRLPNVISLPSPSSRYLVALARAVAQLRPDASVAVVTATGRFADFAWTGFQAEADAISVMINGRFTFSVLPQTAGEGRVGALGAILAIGPVEKEIAFFNDLRSRRPDLLLGGVSPGLWSFPQALGADPESFLAPVQWHPALGQSPQLGPSSSQVLEDARSLGFGSPDYVAAQAYAAALIAAHCHAGNPHDPANAARQLRTSTFFGDFELDPKTGEQRGHAMAVIQWRGGRQELIAGAG